MATQSTRRANGKGDGVAVQLTAKEGKMGFLRGSMVQEETKRQLGRSRDGCAEGPGEDRN